MFVNEIKQKLITLLAVIYAFANFLFWQEQKYGIRSHLLFTVTENYFEKSLCLNTNILCTITSAEGKAI